MEFFIRLLNFFRPTFSTQLHSFSFHTVVSRTLQSNRHSQYFNLGNCVHPNLSFFCIFLYPVQIILYILSNLQILPYILFNCQVLIFRLIFFSFFKQLKGKIHGCIDKLLKITFWFTPWKFFKDHEFLYYLSFLKKSHHGINVPENCVWKQLDNFLDPVIGTTWHHWHFSSTGLETHCSKDHRAAISRLLFLSKVQKKTGFKKVYKYYSNGTDERKTDVGKNRRLADRFTTGSLALTCSLGVACDSFPGNQITHLLIPRKIEESRKRSGTCDAIDLFSFKREWRFLCFSWNI